MRPPAPTRGPRLVCPPAQSGSLASVSYTLRGVEYLYTIWVLKPMNTTAGWVGWSQEFRDQLCSLGFGSEKSDLPVMKTSRHFDKIRGSIICAKHGPIQTDLHFTAVFCLSTVDYSI